MMPNKIYVVAGDLNQFRLYERKKHFEAEAAEIPPLLKDEYYYVAAAQSLRGIHKPSGVFIGTWKDRLDIVEILETLCMAWLAQNQTLNRIRLETTGPKKPTPKIQGKTATQVYIDEAAAMMAKQIDSELINIVMKDSNQWTMLPLKP